MKKTYIAPEALCVCLDPKSALLLDYSDSIGDGTILTKEYVGEEEYDDVTTGGKSIWDDEW